MGKRGVKRGVTGEANGAQTWGGVGSLASKRGCQTWGGGRCVEKKLLIVHSLSLLLYYTATLPNVGAKRGVVGGVLKKKY